jgi:cytochrome c oxidase assembly protein subunit 15
MPPSSEILRLPHDPDELKQRARNLGLAFLAITVLSYALIVLGALVRAHGAGLACPDWPLCFGDFVPRFDLRVAFEWGHRVAAGAISLLFVAASVAALRDSGIRPAMQRLLGLTAIILAVQILLGALTVWQLLASWTVTSHLVTGNAFALCLAFSARRLFRLSAAPTERPAAAAGLRGALVATGALLLLQMVLGGLVASTYVGLACTEWPACNDGIYFPSFEGALGMHLFHRLAAYALTLAIATSAWLGRHTPGLSQLLWTALALVLAQVVAGVANVLLRLPVEVTGLHSALPAALVLTVAFSLAEGFRRPAAD